MKQDCATFSTTEEEYTPLSEGCKESKWLLSVFAGLDLQNLEIGSVSVSTDNRSASSWGANAHNSRQAEYVSIKFRFVQESVSEKAAGLPYIPPTANLSDGFAKPHGPVKFGLFRDSFELSLPPNLQ